MARGALLLAGLFAARAGNAQFPIVESFRNANPGTWTLAGTAQFTSGSSDPVGQGWLRLTDPNGHEAASAIYTSPFSSSAGIVVAFTYATWGGTGADGFSFYLIDGATASPTVGADGGSLGYSVQYWMNCNGAFYQPGVTNGYVGIGFDEYGDFSDCMYGAGGPGLTPEAVAIRGSGSGYDGTGFLYLTGTQISGSPFNQSIATGSRTAARPVRISIINRMIKVEMDFGSGYQTVIDRYDLASAPNQAKLPGTFKMGFGGSTGYFTNYHELRDLTVTMPATLTLAHAVTPATVSVGGSVTYTVTVSNDNTNSVNGIAFSDPVPAAISGVTWTAATAGGASVSSASGSGNGITNTLNLPKNSSVTFTVAGTVSAAAAGTTLTHAASITPPPSISNLGNDSASASVAVNKMASAVALASSGGTSSFGEPVTFTAAVSPVAPGSGTPTGTVTFLDGTTAIGAAALGAGVATFTTQALGVGSHSISAAYSGDALFTGATSATSSLVEVTPSAICAVQSDCAGGDVCVRATRLAEYGVCQPVDTAVGCGTSGGGSSAPGLVLVLLALVARRRPRPAPSTLDLSDSVAFRRRRRPSSVAPQTR